MAEIYKFQAEDREDVMVEMKEYEGKALLIVNTATGCGFTPQYEDLEKMYRDFKDRGFEILDFPCNQFGHQAPGTADEIHEFCTARFDMTFRQFAKIDVNGEKALPLFDYLKSCQGFAGFDMNSKLGPLLDEMMRKADPDYDKKSDIKWNFTKFLVNREGEVIARFEPTEDMAKVRAAVEAAL